MIIKLTRKSGETVGVNFNMVTFIEDCDGLSNVHFPNASIWVKESLSEITTLVELQKIMKGIRR
nr:MAG TPA: Flagellar and Swarming motility protein [Caudoviricetes sp.]